VGFFREIPPGFAAIQKCAPEDLRSGRSGWPMNLLKVPTLPEMRSISQAPYHIDRAYNRTSLPVITWSEREALSMVDTGSYHSGGSLGRSGGGFRGGFGGGGGEGGGGAWAR